MYSTLDLIDAVIEFAHDYLDEAFKRRIDISRVLVAWCRLPMLKSVSPHLIVSVLRDFGFIVSLDAFGLVQVSLPRQLDLPVRQALSEAGALIIHLSKAQASSLYCKQSTSVGKLHVDLDKAAAKATATIIEEATELFLTGRYNLRPLAIAKLRELEAIAATAPLKDTENFDAAATRLSELLSHQYSS